MGPSCEDTARNQICQEVAIRDSRMHQIFTGDNSWGDKKMKQNGCKFSQIMEGTL
jgi:hypothetical protein